jgi:phosphate transport system substrate-binding protein
MRKKTINKICIVSLLALIAMVSCKQPKPKDKFTDTITSGVVQIAANETLEPIIRQEVAVFENRYQNASILPIFTNEVEAIDLLLKDSIRLAIVNRQLSENELKFLKQKKFAARQIKLATDAIAIIVNKENKDSLISIAQLKKILTGETTEWKELNPISTPGEIKFVFDHSNSSTVRYAIDSICKGEPLAENKLFAAGHNKDVIEYVSKNQNAIGVVGVNWIINKEDSTLLSFAENITVMSVSSEDIPTIENSYKPYQAYVALQQYPLIKDVYGISTDPRNGLSTGFLSFLSSDIGQKVILKEGLVPYVISPRIVNLRSNL